MLILLMKELSKDDWDIKFEEILEKSTQKIKLLSQEKEELEIIQFKLFKQRDSIEQDKIELKKMINKYADEIPKLSRSKFDLINEGQHLGEERFLVREKLERINKELSIKDNNYSQNIIGSTLTLTKNQEIRNQEILSMIELHEKLLIEKRNLEDELSNKINFINSLDAQIKEHNLIESKRIDKTTEFNSVVNSLYEMNLKENSYKNNMLKYGLNDIIPSIVNYKSPLQIKKSSQKKITSNLF